MTVAEGKGVIYATFVYRIVKVFFHLMLQDLEFTMCRYYRFFLETLQICLKPSTQKLFWVEIPTPERITGYYCYGEQMKIFEFLESFGVSSHAMFVLELSIVTLWLIIIIIIIIIIMIIVIIIT